MKRYLAVILVFCMLGGMVACNKMVMDQADTSSVSTYPSQSTGSTDASSSVQVTTGVPATESTDGNVSTTAPRETVKPTQAPTPTETAKPTQAPKPTETVKPTQPHSHSYSAQVTKKATCTEDGVRTYTCSCKASYTEKISATGHSWSSWQTVQEPTATVQGKSQRTCGNCSATESKLIPTKPSTDTNTITVTEEELRKIEEGFLHLVNQERNRVGVSPLTTDYYLDDCAQIRSVETVELFSHTRPNGESFHTVVDWEQYPYSMVGENLCMTSHKGDQSYTSADKWVGSDEQIESAYSWMFNLFKNSPGHYANMIKEDYEHCGIGITYQVSNQIIPVFYVAHIFGAK